MTFDLILGSFSQNPNDYFANAIFKEKSYISFGPKPFKNLEKYLHKNIVAVENVVQSFIRPEDFVKFVIVNVGDNHIITIDTAQT